MGGALQAKGGGQKTVAGEAGVAHPGGMKPAYSPILHDLQREHTAEPLQLTGALPEGLHGTLYRNGPGLFAAAGKRYRHWFDGDGVVTACTLRDGQAFGSARVVQNAGLREERRRKRPLFDSYGSAFASTWARLRGRASKNVANTSVMLWQGRLFALMEGGEPTELHPETLETLGETDFEGTVLQTFSAHPHAVSSRRAAYNFGVRYGRVPMLDLFELPDSGKARRLTSLPMPWMSLIHDFIVTQRYMVFFIPPVCMRPLQYYLFGKSYGEALQWQPRRGTRIMLVPIDAPHTPITLEAEPFYQWHFANAHDADDETVVVELVRYPDFASNAQFAQLMTNSVNTPLNSHYCRATLNTRRKTVALETVHPACCEFPRVAPAELTRAHSAVYLAGFADGSARTGLTDALFCLDPATGVSRKYALPAGHYPSEPVFVPGAGTSGVVLSVVFDPQRQVSYLSVLDATQPDRAPLARADFTQPLPTSFHGNFYQTR